MINALRACSRRRSPHRVSLSLREPEWGLSWATQRSSAASPPARSRSSERSWRRSRYARASEASSGSVSRGSCTRSATALAAIRRWCAPLASSTGDRHSRRRRWRISPRHGGRKAARTRIAAGSIGPLGRNGARTIRSSQLTCSRRERWSCWKRAIRPDGGPARTSHGAPIRPCRRWNSCVRASTWPPRQCYLATTDAPRVSLRRPTRFARNSVPNASALASLPWKVSFTGSRSLAGLGGQGTPAPRGER